MTDVWLGHRIAEPLGRLAAPRTWMRHAARNSGVKRARATG